MIHRKNWLWWLIGAVIFFAIASVGISVIAVIVVAVGYLISLRIHPFMTCRSCGGNGRHPGAVFGWAHRQCGSCGGQGRHRRFGTVMFHSGSPVRAEIQAAEARDQRRARPL